MLESDHFSSLLFSKNLSMKNFISLICKKINFALKRYIKFIIENKLLLLLYSLSISFFIYKHATRIFWDFSAYILNAKYVFSNGYYFEWQRPILPYFLLGVFSIFGWKYVKYIYIIFVLTLHLFSCIEFSKYFKLDKRFFYLFSLSFYALFSGITEGTELLSISLLQLFISYIFTSKIFHSSFVLSLLLLTRYPNIIYIPLLLFFKDKKNIILVLLISFLLIAPWLFWNKMNSESIFTSLADAYAMNIKYRDYAKIDIFSIIKQVLIVGNYLLPLSIIGLLLRLKKAKSKAHETILKDFLLIVILLLTLISYLLLPTKIERYLFHIIFPLAYFSSILISFIIKKFGIKKRKIELFVILIIALNFSFLILFEMYSHQGEDPRTYKIEYNEMCMTSSNAWVFINYFGIPSEPYPREEEVYEMISTGYRIILFKNIREPPYLFNSSFMEKLPIIEKKENYVIIGNKNRCKKIEKFEYFYIKRLNEFLKKYHNYTIETHPCKVLLNRLCLFVV